MAENFLNMGRDLDTHVHEANRSPENYHLKHSSPRHRITTLSKTKDKENLKTLGENKIQSHKGTPKLSVNGMVY